MKHGRGGEVTPVIYNDPNFVYHDFDRGSWFGRFDESGTMRFAYEKRTGGEASKEKPARDRRRLFDASTNGAGGNIHNDVAQ
mmetsp:Transcript_2351/g.6854  ORF Transcript_2351/g.6854 Transcript_2351/m.6854 type:complete len:82 (-) Transcript_2351:111-356(-)